MYVFQGKQSAGITIHVFIAAGSQFRYLLWACFFINKGFKMVTFVLAVLLFLFIADAFGE